MIGHGLARGDGSSSRVRAGSVSRRDSSVRALTGYAGRRRSVSVAPRLGREWPRCASGRRRSRDERDGDSTDRGRIARAVVVGVEVGEGERAHGVDDGLRATAGVAAQDVAGEPPGDRLRRTGNRRRRGCDRDGARVARARRSRAAGSASPLFPCPVARSSAASQVSAARALCCDSTRVAPTAHTC